MLAFISKTADGKIIHELEANGFTVSPLPPHPSLDKPVNTHSDMLLLVVGNTVFTHNEYFIPSLAKRETIIIPETLGNKYPNDILLNIAIVGKHVFANIKHASKSVLDHLSRLGLEIHGVSQGYAHCSTCIISDNAAITADEGIAVAMRNVGIDVLLIEKGYISLPPYEYGFIGGTSGTTNDTVFFCGSLSYHPDGEKIKQFITKHGKNICELSDAPLCDVGGITFI